MLLRGGMPLSYPLNLALKTLQFLLISAIAVLFCTDNPNGNLSQSIITGLVLLMYFIGKVQNMQMRNLLRIQIQGRMVTETEKPKMGLEFGIVALAMAVFTFLLWKPEFAQNNISTWFYSNIIDIEDTPIFGFIFKIVGFFFTITMLMRMVNALGFIFSGRAFQKQKSTSNYDQNDDPNHFDDYEEIK